MNAHDVRELLLWSALVNYSVLTLWFVAFSRLRPWLYRLHSRWFPLSEPEFVAIHYVGMAAYKILVLALNVAPLAAMLITGAGSRPGA